MTVQIQARFGAKLSRLAAIAGGLVVLVGCLVLIGWATDTALLKQIAPNLVAMNPMTAVCFILAGVSLLLQLHTPTDQANKRRRWLAQVCALTVALIGLLRLAGYLSGWDLGVDRLLFPDKLIAVGDLPPNRMAPNTAFNFVVVSGALLLGGKGRRVTTARLLALVTALVAVLALIGYVFGARELYGIASYIPMALHTAATFLILSLGIILLRPDPGLVAILLSDGPAGQLARTLAPAAVLVPFVLGWLRLAGERLGLYSTAYGTTLVTVANMVAFSFIVWRSAASLHRADERRRLADTALRLSNMALEAQANEMQLANAALEIARQEADQANRAKSEFLSRMSHELRTPLNAILGFAQLLDLGELDAGERQGIKHILHGGKHLLNLINEVLDIARVETGQLSLSPEPVRLDEILAETVDLIRPLATPLDIRINLDPVPEDFVQADRQRLRQVLLNLLSNAVKYNHKSGTITVACEARPDQWLRLSVTDTGAGIAADKLSRVFSPFDRLGAEQSTIEGAGLGLALSQGLMAAMDGRIGVESRVDRGSTFWIELPLVAGPLDRLDQPGLQGADPPPESGTAKTLLYVEDNAANLTLVEQILTHRPTVRLMTAIEGGLGLALAREHRPDLILLDLNLPDLHGSQVLSALQADGPTRQIPVVVMSADATPGQVERLLAAGARTFLTKPIDVEHFLEVLDNSLWPGASNGKRDAQQPRG